MMKQEKIAETPLMKQYFKVKAEHPEAVLLFRVGDFYETFADDALIASKVLGIVLTKRANGSASSVPLAGFPHHSIDMYLPKLVRAGYKVAVCDQLEDPKLTKKIVKRGVTELVTPGIAFSDQLLEQKEHNYLAGLTFDNERCGAAFLDVSTGTFQIAEGSLAYIETLLSSFAPKELLVSRSYAKGVRERLGDGYYISTLDEWAFVYESSAEKLRKQLGVDSLKGFGIEGFPLGVTSAGALLVYLEQTQHTGLRNICSISRIDEGKFVWMDKFTFRNLEIFSSAAGGEGVSLVSVIDKCSSPMGARLLRTWLAMPVMDLDELNSRYDVVEHFVRNGEDLQKLQELIGNIGDLERIISRAAAGKISPREVMQLKRGLEQTDPIRRICRGHDVAPLERMAGSLDGCSDLLDALGRTMCPDPAAAVGKGDVIASGVSEELDSLRNLARHSKDILLEIQQREMERTGITSLKISYNSVFGYYLEVRNAHKDKVPSDWIRKQTLVNAERYITAELKEYEEKILGAEEKIYVLEAQIYAGLVAQIQDNIAAIQGNCRILSRLDVLSGFAELAVSNRYCRPEMNDGHAIDIKGGRHPVIETLMPAGEEFVPNDVFLDDKKQQIIILTGPNMAGKSALLRQTALIVLLAQVGSFVPADSASIGWCDKLFTRVGASDNISRGESTFMVEMLETSMILHNLSSRSLVLLDEIGRGTSTYDGMSIARAIVEYIHEYGHGAKTLFATHYHELNDLENIYPRVRNFHIAVKEVGKNVIFLRKLKEGGVAHSFGIHVARLAGMPRQVIESAERTLAALENQPAKRVRAHNVREGRIESDGSLQLSFFQLEDPLLMSLRDELNSADLNNMTPLQAFDLLRDMKTKMGI
ncbi:MAG: DNA mismatch repair protein MutS [Bacteroidetes bacterium]|uniref:DNA mismatch repair protein MutS n=1 Tax=Candidatus Cryptobacteroides gallistercoris TaxID=2840765 RepID=A0A940DPE8_9BACT|nr:DNA mismatch repair protein MutS [Candidatus Cryptobacteroides gallistercoris]